jgi:hypothetical protein
VIRGVPPPRNPLLQFNPVSQGIAVGGRGVVGAICASGIELRERPLVCGPDWRTGESLGVDMMDLRHRRKGNVKVNRHAIDADPESLAATFFRKTENGRQNPGEQRPPGRSYRR